MPNILLVNSEKVSDEFLNIFRELEEKGLHFYILSNKEEILSLIKRPEKRGKKIFLGPPLSNNFYLALFVFLIPFIFLRQFLELYFLVRKKDINKVICTNWNEKLIFTPLAKFFKLPIIWIELPTVDYDKPRLLLKLYRSISGKVKIITFLSVDKFKLSKLCDNIDNIRTVNPGVEIGIYEHQDTIFSGMAKTRHSDKNKNSFTLGVVDFSHSSQIESLFKAIKKTLDVIPGLRLIVISGNEEKRSLEWLAKKMDIHHLVWLVGEQKDWKRWIESFDVFLALSDRPSFFDLEVVMASMLKGVPVIGLKAKGYEELIEESRTGALIDHNNSEVLAQKIVKLYQDKQLRGEIAENARAVILNNYNREKQLDKLKQLILAS